MSFDAYCAFLKQIRIMDCLGQDNAFQIFLSCIVRTGTNLLRSALVCGTIFQRPSIIPPKKLDKNDPPHEWPGTPRMKSQNRLVVTQQDFALLILLSIIAPYVHDSIDEIEAYTQRFLDKLVFGPSRRKALHLPENDRMCDALVIDYKHRCSVLHHIDHYRVRRTRLSPFS